MTLLNEMEAEAHAAFDAKPSQKDLADFLRTTYSPLMDAGVFTVPAVIALASLMLAAWNTGRAEMDRAKARKTGGPPKCPEPGCGLPADGIINQKFYCANRHQW